MRHRLAATNQAIASRLPPAAGSRCRTPKGTIHKQIATFRFTATVAGSTFQCKLDKKSFKGCKSPKTYRGLVEGKHVIKVRAIGPTDLIDPKAAKRTFKVDL